jgi:cyclic pyranopterin phosphate synthase
MTPSEIESIVGIASSLGVRKVKITGGEPLIREDIVEIVSRLSPLVREVSMTTNGAQLEENASLLKAAGLARVNVSLHSLDPTIYRRLCGTDALDDVTAGIRAAISAGLSPVKVNMVVFKGENDSEIDRMAEFCGDIGAILQLIEFESDRRGMNDARFAARFFPLSGVEEGLSRRATEVEVNELHRRKRYTIPANGHSVTVEVVRPMHNTEFCANCTRIRLSSDGRLKPCLLDPAGEVDVLGPLRSGATGHELRELFLEAVSNRKPYWS